jgi:hypothetical protein
MHATEKNIVAAYERPVKGGFILVPFTGFESDISLVPEQFGESNV